MREEFRYRPADREKVEQLRSILLQFESAQDPEEQQLQAESFRQRSGGEHDSHDLANYWRSTDVETFLDEAAQPQARRIEGLTRAELVLIAQSILDARTEAEQQFYMKLFDAQMTRPDASLLAFHPPDGLGSDDWDPSANEIVELALNYRLIRL